MTREKLTPRQAKFVRNLLDGMPKGKAALAAGYTPKNAANSATRMLNLESVLDALRIGAEAQIRGGVYVGARILRELAESAKSEDIKLRAAVALLDRGGLPLAKISEHHHIVTDRRSDAELRAHAIALARQLAIPVPKEILDAQFSEIKPAVLPAPAAEAVASPVAIDDPFDGLWTAPADDLRTTDRPTRP